MNYPTTAKDVANYIAKEINKYNKSKNIQEQISLTNRRLQLLLYFCEIEYMKQKESPLFADDFNAWPHGPTIPMIASQFAQYFNGQMCLYKDCIEPSDEIKTIIHKILDTTKNIDTLDLQKIVNVTNGPWHQVYNEDDHLHEQVISKEAMQFQNNQVHLKESETSELETIEKNIPSSIFKSQEEADKLSAAIIEKRKSKNSESITYEQQENETMYTYKVTCDKETLNEILEKLKKYRYVSVGHAKLTGEVTKWSATKKKIQKRVTELFNLSYSSKISNHKLHPETIVHHTEKGNDFVTYEYSFEKLPDLYFYIDIIINNQRAMEYYDLFGYTPKGISIIASQERNKQLAVEEILNYIDSPELVDHNFNNSKEFSNQKYDYKGLNELYKETLECFKFELNAIKKYLNNQEKISGLLLQRKRK